MPLPDVTEKDLRTALAATTDSARYWQEPDGDDILAATEPMRPHLRRIAEHLTASEHAWWWTTDIVRDEQWSLGWTERHSSVPRGRSPAGYLAGEGPRRGTASRARTPTDPTAHWSGV